MPARRQEAKARISSRGNRDRNGKNVVDEQSRARDDAEAWAEKFRRHYVAAPAEGKVFDNAGVGVGNDEDSEGSGDEQADRKIMVLAECAESLLRTVGGRRHPI